MKGSINLSLKASGVIALIIIGGIIAGIGSYVSNEDLENVGFTLIGVARESPEIPGISGPELTRSFEKRN